MYSDYKFHAFCECMLSNYIKIKSHTEYMKFANTTTLNNMLQHSL